MMNAKQKKICQQLSAYLDGQLGDEQARRVAEAVEHDPDIHAELKALESTRNLLRQLPRESAPESLLGAVLAQVERNRLLEAPAEAPQARPFRWVRHLATAAIVVLGVGLGIYLQQGLNRGAFEDIYGGPQAHRSAGDDEPLADARGRVPEAEATPATDTSGKSADAKGDALAFAAGADRETGLKDKDANGLLADGSYGLYKGRTEPPLMERAAGPVPMGQAAAGIRNIVLLTNDLPATETQVVQVLNEASIDNALPHVSNLNTSPAVARNVQQSLGRANVYVLNRDTPQEKELTVWVSPDQLGELSSNLTRIDQANQLAMRSMSRAEELAVGGRHRAKGDVQPVADEAASVPPAPAPALAPPMTMPARPGQGEMKYAWSGGQAAEFDPDLLERPDSPISGDVAAASTSAPAIAQAEDGTAIAGQGAQERPRGVSPATSIEQEVVGAIAGARQSRGAIDAPAESARDAQTGEQAAPPVKQLTEAIEGVLARQAPAASAPASQPAQSRLALREPAAPPPQPVYVGVPAGGAAGSTTASAPAPEEPKSADYYAKLPPAPPPMGELIEVVITLRQVKLETAPATPSAP